MGKKRVYEFAKEKNIESKKVIEIHIKDKQIINNKIDIIKIIKDMYYKV